MKIDPCKFLEALAVPLFVAHDSINRAKDMTEHMPDVAERVYIFGQLQRANHAMNSLLEVLSEQLGAGMPPEGFESGWLHLTAEPTFRAPEAK